MIVGAVLLLAGLVLAGLGGELFVRGLLGFARWVRIAPAVVALTLAAFATSSPELSVAVNAAVEGRPQIGFGNALGANIVNIALVLGIALSMRRFDVARSSARRDLPVAFLAPVLTALLIIDGALSRIDGFLMLGLFVAWLSLAVIEGWKQRSAAKEVLGEPRRLLILLSCLGGLALLMIAGRLIVSGGVRVGQGLGLSLFVLGATIVSLGTTIPELATTIVARMRGHGEVGLGTVLGSNIFNGLFVIAIVAIIHPIAIRWQEVIAALGFGALVIGIIYPWQRSTIARRRGPFLLAAYVAYAVTLLQFQPVN